MMNGKTIDEKIDWLFKINASHSHEFLRTRMSRQLYRNTHPTEIGVFKCMDGRVHIPRVTRIPLGIIRRRYRNIGGYFDLGWPMLGEDVAEWIEYSISKKRRVLILLTYHFSAGDRHRCCAGFGYDTKAAFEFSVNFYRQFQRLLGENNQVVFPVVVGLETDSDSLIWHQEQPTEQGFFTCSEESSNKEEDLLEAIRNLYPNMDPCVQWDLLPLMKGNIKHVKEVKESKREPLDMEHREWILQIGRGFDWLHEPNTALVVGPYSPDLSGPVRKAIEIIADNMKAARINDDGFLVLSSELYKECGLDHNRAQEKANFFREYVRKILADEYPELAAKAKYQAVIVDEHTRLATIVQR